MVSGACGDACAAAELPRRLRVSAPRVRCERLRRAASLWAQNVRGSRFALSNPLRYLGLCRCAESACAVASVLRRTSAESACAVAGSESACAVASVLRRPAAGLGTLLPPDESAYAVADLLRRLTGSIPNTMPL